MKSLRLCWCVLLLCGALLGRADSLWTANTPPLFADPKAHTVGDLLTVVINTTSSVSTQAQHVTSKASVVNASSGSGILSGFLGMGVNAARNTNGSGSAATNTSFIDQLTVTVKSVLPNGNLVVQGERAIKLEKDDMLVTFSGTVRPQDINPDNTVASSVIADQHLVTRGTGPIAEKQRPGLMSRILSWLW